MTEPDYQIYTWGPADEEKKPEQLVILLHGLGSDGQDLISLAPYYAQAIPNAVFVSPDAPFRCDMAPRGYQWFSLQDRAPEKVLAGVMRAAPILDSFIAEQMDKYDIPAQKTALVGFSQGTMMSLYAAPRFPEKLAGVLAYSGALIAGYELDQDGIQKVPVNLIHGNADMVVPVEKYYEAETLLKKHGFDVQGHVTEGLGHGIDEQGIQEGARFLKSVLSD